MYQDQNQYSIDYLNQIAPQAPKKGLGGKLPLVLALLGGTIVLAIILGVLSSLGGAGDTPERLAVRLQSTETIASEAQKNIKSSQLRSLNSNLQIFLTNTNRDLAAPLTAQGINLEKLDAATVAQESGDELTTTLEEARLNAIYDRTYAREMSYQLETLLLLMQQVYDSTKSASFKEVLTTSYNNLAPIQKSFSEFNAANG